MDISEWYRDHGILYSRLLKDFKDTLKKERIYNEKATLLDPPFIRK